MSYFEDTYPNLVGSLIVHSVVIITDVITSIYYHHSMWSYTFGNLNTIVDLIRQTLCTKKCYSIHNFGPNSHMCYILSYENTCLHFLVCLTVTKDITFTFLA